MEQDNEDELFGKVYSDNENEFEENSDSSDDHDEDKSIMAADARRHRHVKILNKMITRLQAALSNSNGKLPNVSDPKRYEINNCMINNEPDEDMQSECKRTSTIQISQQNNQLTDNIISQQSIPNLPGENKQSEVETNFTNLNIRASSSQEKELKKKPHIKACLISIRKPSRNPYINFVQAYKNQLKKESNGVSGKEFVFRVSAKWNSLTETQKKPFRDMAKQIPYKKRTYKKKPKKRKPAKSSSYSTDVSIVISDSTYYSPQTSDLSESRANSTTSSYTTTRSTYGSRTTN